MTDGKVLSSVHAFENEQYFNIYNNKRNYPLQGQSRRVQVEVRSVQDSGTLPLIAEGVLSIAMGCVKMRPARTQKYQDTHLVRSVTNASNNVKSMSSG